MSGAGSPVDRPSALLSSLARTIAPVLALAVALTVAAPSRAAEVGGVSLPDSATVGGERLPLRGAGIRKKLFLKLYVAALYAGESAGATGPAIAAADAPMMVRLVIVSDLVTRERMVEALNEGFAKSTGGNTAPVQAGIDQALAAMPDSLGAGERIDMAYVPGIGLVVVRDGATLATVEGIAFKEALFGIWLSDDPVQANLKRDMLGG